MFASLFGRNINVDLKLMLLKLDIILFLLAPTITYAGCSFWKMLNVCDCLQLSGSLRNLKNTAFWVRFVLFKSALRQTLISLKLTNFNKFELELYGTRLCNIPHVLYDLSVPLSLSLINITSQLSYFLKNAFEY